MRQKPPMPQTPDKAQRLNNLKITRWLETQRGRSQYRPAPPLARPVTKIMRPLTRKHGSGVKILEPVWDKIMGARFAKISEPVKFTGAPDSRTLVIKAPGPASALIMASNTQIIDRLNAFLGPGYVRSIKVISGAVKSGTSRAAKTQISKPQANKLPPETQKQLSSGLENITDPDLKAALEKLGEQVLAKHAGKS